jgi:hypothetical protein
LRSKYLWEASTFERRGKKDGGAYWLSESCGQQVDVAVVGEGEYKYVLLIVGKFGIAPSWAE